MSNTIKDCCLQVKDYYGNDVIFHEKRRREKARQHPELNDTSDNGFVKKRIPRSIVNPDHVYQDLTDQKIRNYYKEESYVDTPRSRTYIYTKVVVSTMWQPWVILTAYETQHIKEEGSGKCLYQRK